MRTVQIFCIFFLLLTHVSEAWTTCRPPDSAEIGISRTKITFHFLWNEANGPINCGMRDAVEFEFLIDTSPYDKCFAQPVGGKDNTSYKNVKFEEFSGYVDIWNYFFDYTVDEANQILKDQCGDSLNDKWAEKAVDYDNSLLFEFDDKIANFAVGTTDTQQFKTGTQYGIVYNLEVPVQPECQVYGADDGFVQVNMVVMQNTCTLETSQEGKSLPYYCPHLLGFWGCENYTEPTTYTLQHRLCAPTGGVWEIEDPASPSVSRGGGTCEDNNNNGIFANVPEVELFGNNLVDCFENILPNVTDEEYGGLGQASLEVIYPKTTRQNPVTFNKTLVITIRASDPDGIKQFTITIDELLDDKCKVRRKVSLGPGDQDYVLTLDLEACLGTNYGEHVFKVWIVDRCTNVYESVVYYYFNYQPGEDQCNSSSYGEILFYNPDGSVDYTVSDYDGVIFSSIVVNGIDTDGCKFRTAFPQIPYVSNMLYDANKQVDLNKCFYSSSEELASLGLWVVDTCGNVSMVHSLP